MEKQFDDRLGGMTYETATAQVERLNTIAKDIRERDLRLRRIIDYAVSQAMSDHGPVDPERADQDAHDIALRAATLAVAQVVDQDAELKAARAERDRYRDLAVKGLSMTPMTYILQTPTPDAEKR